MLNMLNMDLNMPVTLVVKAPNQKFADLTVECALGWTIRKVKEHLAKVYPNKPKQDHQKLIYSGRLLHDHLILRDVLRQYDESQTTHTVHLVCSQAVESNGSDAQPADGSPVTNSTNTLSSSIEGLRQRHGTSHRQHDSMEIPATTTTAPVYTAAPHDAFQQFYGGLDANLAGGAFYPGMMPAAMMAYSPEQMQWMQQMYAQQMAQFMQLYQGGYPSEPANPLLPEAANIVPPPAEDHAPQNRPVNQRPADGQVRMNAQGGPVMDDDEDDANRDWLDWVYTLCRFMVLISIVYFYSTLGRFVVVFGFFLVVYLYHAGYIRMNLGQDEQQRQRQRQPNPAQQQQQQEEQEAQRDEQQNQDTQDEDQDSSSGEEGGNNETEEAQQVEPDQPPQPGALAVAWSFFTTFFSSLIPQQPAAVNAN